VYLFIGYNSHTKIYIAQIKRRVFKLLLFFFGSMFCIWILFPQDFVITFYKFFNLGFTKHWSIVDRWKGIVNCLEVFKENPIFGVGIGGIGPYLYPIFENKEIAITLKQMEKYDPTNVLSEILASLGLVGMGVFGFIVYQFWDIFIKTMRNSLPIALHERRIGIALIISLVCVIIVLQFNQGLFRSYVWTHAAITLSYLRTLQWANRENCSRT
jgi:O-antigen ligase